MRSSILFIFSLLSIINVSCFAMKENRIKEDKTKNLFNYIQKQHNDASDIEQYYKSLNSLTEEINLLSAEYKRTENIDYKIEIDVSLCYSKITINLSQIKHHISCIEQKFSPKNNFRSYYISTIIKKINNVDNPLTDPDSLNKRRYS